MAKKPLFPRRRPRTPSPRERVVSVGLLVGLVGACLLFIAAGRRPGPPGLPESDAMEPAPTSSLFSASSPGGWPRGAVESYDTDTLFEKINGKAGAYLAYGFERLHFASYTDPARPDTSWIDVYVYEMTSPLDAFGVYRSQRSGSETPLEAGDEAVTTSMAVFGRRGPYYAEVMVADKAALAEAEALVKALLAGVEAPEDDVLLPRYFPAEGLGRITFDRQGAADVDALKDAFTATYEDGKRLVVARTTSVEAAQAAAEEAREMLDFLGEPALVGTEGSAVLLLVGFGDEAEDRLQALRDAVRKETP